MLVEKINELKSKILTENMGWCRHSGVPFILTVINQDEQLYLHIKLKELKEDANIQGYNLEIVNIEEKLFELLKEDEGEGLTELFDFEMGNINEFKSEMQTTLLRLLHNWIVKRSKELGERGRMVFTRVGSTAPHFRFIQLLSKLENQVSIPLVFFIPGTLNETSLKMLDKYEISRSRALVI